MLCFFTTSYNEYAVKVFKVNSVDYLLKPVQKEELQAALTKFKKLQPGSRADISFDNHVKELQQKLQPKEYRKSFLVKYAQKQVSIEVNDIAFFYNDGRPNFLKTHGNWKFVVDYTMDEL